MHVLMQLAPEHVDRSLLPDKLVVRPSRAALDLAAETGLIEPIVVRRSGNKAFPRYQLLSGVAALEIADRSALPRVPAVVIDSISDADAREFVRAHLRSGYDPNFEAKLSPPELFQMLDAVEHAKFIRTRSRERCTYKSLAQEYGISPVVLSHLRRVKGRLHNACMDDLLDGRISLGHAKALARFPKNEQPRVATRIIRRGYSVRRVEESARKRIRNLSDELSDGVFAKDPDLIRVEQDISYRFGWKTEIEFDAESGKGSITFHFDTLDGYEYILERLGIDPRID